MRQIYIIAFVMLPQLFFSQLYIKPTANQNSFLFSEGQLVYVEKDVNLFKNNPGHEEASIYLRKEAQLIQGKTNTLNSGNGLLSVFQEGNANEYTYNYWSPPVINTSENLLFGNLLYEPVNKTHSTKAIITGQLNGTSQPLQISNRWIYKFSGLNYADWVYIGNNFNLMPGEGFTMKGVSGKNVSTIIFNIFNNSGNHQRYDFRGRPNNGIYSLPIKPDEVKLIGNPYPSALDLNQFLIDNTSTTGIAYFWDSSLVPSHNVDQYEGGYGTYSPAGGMNIYVPAIFSKYNGDGNQNNDTGQSGKIYGRRFSPIGQGFIVIGSKEGQLIFKNEYRSYIIENSETSEFKSTSKHLDKTSSSDFPNFELSIGFDNTYTRRLITVFNPIATKGLDHAMDAINLSIIDSDAGWLIDNELCIIDVRPLDLTDQIPLSLYLDTSMDLKFSIKSSNNLTSDIFLLDTENNNYYNLRDNDFKINLMPGDFNNRFKITFTSNTTLINSRNDIASSGDNSEFNIFQDNANRILEIRALTYKSCDKIILYDSLGRKIFEAKGDRNMYYYEFPTHKLSNGVYILKILDKERIIISKKIIISN